MDHVVRERRKLALITSLLGLCKRHVPALCKTERYVEVNNDQYLFAFGGLLVAFTSAL